MTDLNSERHPLDGTDPDQCYQIMMTERTALITARQDLENNLIRVIIQLASALIVLMAGFVTEKDLVLAGCAKVLLTISFFMLVISIVCGLAEHWFAAKAYLFQQDQVEKYFSKKIAAFQESRDNVFVKACQLICFLAFTTAIVAIMFLAFIQLWEKTDVSQRQLTSSTTTTSSSSSAASAASAASAPAAAPAAASGSAAK